VTVKSPYESIPAGNRWYSDSAIVQANDGDKVPVVVTGTGCFLFMAYRWY
jgi:hypothetical protein